MGKERVLRLSKPKIQQVEGEKVQLYCDVVEGDVLHPLYYETDKEFEKYLCYERADSFVLAVFPYALREGLDIVCDAPLTASLLHNINVVLVPLLIKYDHRLEKVIKVVAEADNTFIEGEEVGTGISLGVDSFYTIKAKMKAAQEEYKLTHLLFTSSKPVKHESEERKLEAKKVARLLGFPVVLITTNSREEFRVGHDLGHPFTNLSAVFALQKLFRIYYYSTTLDISQFSIQDNSVKDADHYLLLIMHVLSIPELSFYMSGSHTPRVEKVKEIADWEIAQKYLRVCLADVKNCGVSRKCKRTLLEIDTLDKLENFRESFDIDYYLENKIWYFKDSFKLLKADGFDSNFMKPLHDYFWKKEPELMKEAEQLALKEIKQENMKKENAKKRKLMRFDMQGRLDELCASDVEHYAANKALYFKRLILKPEHHLMKPMHDYFWKKEPDLMKQAEKLVSKDIAREEARKENAKKRKLMEFDMLGKLDEQCASDVEHYLTNRVLYFKRLILKPEHHLMKPIHDYFWKKEPELMKQAEELVLKEIASEKVKKENAKKRKLMKFDMLGKLDEQCASDVEHYLANKPLYFKRLILKPEHHLMKPLYDYFWEKEPELMKQAEGLVNKERKDKTRTKLLKKFLH